MLDICLRLLFTVPLLLVAGVVVATWLLRRRPGRLRPAWILGFGALLLAADPAGSPPLPGEPSPGPHHTIEAGFGAGGYQTCGGARTYAGMGAMYRYTTPISDQTDLVVGGGGYRVVDGADLTGGVRAEVGLEHRWIGGAVGGLAGRLSRTDTVDARVLPAARLRLGPRDVFFLEANLLDGDPMPLPGPWFEVGAGVAFPALGNRWEPLGVRAGLNAGGVYLAPSLPLGEAGNLEVMGAYGDPDTWGASARVRLHLPAAGR